MNVVIYARYSSHNQTEQSIEGQVHVIEQYCESNNMTIVGKYFDRATSASKNLEKRESFLQMIKDAENGNFEAIVVYKLDRFARNRYDSANYKFKLKKLGVQVISATERISDNPEGIILESVLEGMAEFFSAELSQKVKRGFEESAHKHKYLGGIVPLGFKIENGLYVIDEETAPIVREAFALMDEGKTAVEMCRIFNGKGYTTTKGNKFNKNSFWRMLRNKKYIGVYSFNDYEAEDALPAIVDKELFERVQTRLNDISNRSTPGKYKAKIPYLLSGKIVCGECGYNYSGRSTKKGSYRYYGCNGRNANGNNCKAPNIRCDILEKAVLNDVLELLTEENIEAISKVAAEESRKDIELNTNIRGLQKQLEEKQKAQSNLMKMAELGDTPDIILNRIKELDKEIRQITKDLKLESQTVFELDEYQIMFFLSQFKDGDIEDQLFAQTLINLLVNKIVIYHNEDNEKEATVKVVYNITNIPEKTYFLGDKSNSSYLERNGTPLGAKYEINNRTISRVFTISIR